MAGVASMTASAILYAAADLIERDGWCQHESTDFYGGRCALTAIEDSGGGYASRYATEKFRAFIGGGSIAEWNDDPGQSLVAVVLMLRKAASWLGASESW